jgi:hypothetical protein
MMAEPLTRSASPGSQLGFWRPPSASSARSGVNVWTGCSSSVVDISKVVVHEYVEHYNGHRPHRSLGQRPPQPNGASPAVLKDVDPSRLKRSDRIGGLVHEYHLVA